MYLCSLRFLVCRKRDSLIMRKGGLEMQRATPHEKPLKYASARPSRAENCVLLIILPLKRIKLVVCSWKICCRSLPNFFPFLPYQSIAILISALSVLPPYLPPDPHWSRLPFSFKFTSVKLPRWIKPARFSHYLMGNSSAEASFSERDGFCSWPPPCGCAPRHDDNLTFWCAAFSSCTPARWWCVLALKASTKQ